MTMTTNDYSQKNGCVWVPKTEVRG